MASEPEMQAPGRPRDPQKDQDALAAARELLAEVGYQGTTIAAVARRAGIGAPTIYRRWRRREALIEDAAFAHSRPAPLPAATGDLHADLHAWVEAFLVYKRFLLRNERDVRALFAERLAVDGVAQHAEAAFDFLVDSTLLRAVTLGMVNAAEFCERTANALAALVHSSWSDDR
jgi:AcrR family transcriptional regulator